MELAVAVKPGWLKPCWPTGSPAGNAGFLPQVASHSPGDMGSAVTATSHPLLGVCHYGAVRSRCPRMVLISHN